MARPCKSEEEKLSERITVRFTPSEYKILMSKAAKAGVDESFYVRESVLKSKVVEKNTVDASLLSHLGKIGSNLNQITKRINSNAYVEPLREKDLKVLSEVHETLRQLSLEILKGV